MLDIIWKLWDRGPQIYEYVENVIDIKIFVFSLFIIGIIEATVNADYLQKNALNLFSPDIFPLDPGYSSTFHWYPFGSIVPLIIILFVISAFINRKSYIYLSNINHFFQFYERLDKKIESRGEFNDVWNKYQKICEILDKNFQYLNAKSHDDGITLIFRRLKFFFQTKAKLQRRNINTAAWSDDIEYQHKILLYNYIQKICDFEAQYTPENHLDIKDEFIIKPLKQIQLEDELINIIEYCHIDGKGFLSTLALENLIAISLSLSDQKRLKILEKLKTMDVKNIGWLNRRLFEVILVNVALNNFSDTEWDKLNKEVNELDAEILSIGARLMCDERIEKIKTDFRENVLKKYISVEGLKNV